MRVRYSVAALVALCISAADASQLYRYKDETGRTVMGQSVPPKLVGQGYEILGPDGRVLQVVKPALTAEQIAERDEQLAKLAKDDARLQSQQEVDAKLKLLYTHPNDAVRMLERRAQDILTAAASKRSKIAFAGKQIVELESQAAERQRKGLAVLQATLDKMSQADNEIEVSKAELVELDKNYAELKRDFGQKITRLEVITNQSATKYPELLDFLNAQNILEGNAEPDVAPELSESEAAKPDAASPAKP